MDSLLPGVSPIMLVEHYEDLEINNNLQLDLGAFKSILHADFSVKRLASWWPDVTQCP